MGLIRYPHHEQEEQPALLPARLVDRQENEGDVGGQERPTEIEAPGAPIEEVKRKPREDRVDPEKGDEPEKRPERKRTEEKAVVDQHDHGQEQEPYGPEAGNHDHVEMALAVAAPAVGLPRIQIDPFRV